MTEQIEDDFWAQERARAVAERGQQADPSACGTCRDRVAAGGQVEHDECAQRATLLPAPDAPSWELITGMPEEDVFALPARFHVPVFMDSCTPKAWVCAVCWGDGWNTQWPCKTAQDHGTRVFTPERHAETVAKKQAARIAELEAQLAEMTHCRDNALRALYRDDIETGIDLEETIAAPFYGPGWDWDDSALQQVVREAAAAVRPAFGKLTQQRDKAHDRVTELETERKKYVGAEPTIAEEMAYLSRCLHAVYEVCDEAVRQATRWENPLPVPEWVEQVRAAADGLVERTSYPPALPWAALMDEEDLTGFLRDLDASMRDAGRQARFAGRPQAPAVLAALEITCGTWRPIAEAQHAHNAAAGPNAGEGQ